MRRFLVLLVLGLAVAVADAAPAAACSCAPRSPAEQLAESEEVYVGELASTAPVIDRTDDLLPYRLALRFDVDEVFVGDVGRTAEVWAYPGTGSLCGLGAEVGQRWLVFASRDDPQDDHLVTGFCSASQRLPGAAAAWVGEGHPPDPDVPAPPERSATDDLARATGALAAAGALAVVGLRIGTRRRAQQAPG